MRTDRKFNSEQLEANTEGFHRACEMAGKAINIFAAAIKRAGISICSNCDGEGSRADGVCARCIGEGMTIRSLERSRMN